MCACGRPFSLMVSPMSLASPASSWVLPAILVVILTLSAAACGGGDALTDDQMRKLAPALQKVVKGEDPPPMANLVTATKDGATVYAVILRVSDGTAVRDAGIPLNSVQGSVATARLTVGQIREAARLAAVDRIEPSGRTQPTGQPSGQSPQ